MDIALISVPYLETRVSFIWRAGGALSRLTLFGWLSCQQKLLTKHFTMWLNLHNFGFIM